MEQKYTLMTKIVDGPIEPDWKKICMKVLWRWCKKGGCSGHDLMSFSYANCYKCIREFTSIKHEFGLRDVPWKKINIKDNK